MKTETAYCSACRSLQTICKVRDTHRLLKQTPLCHRVAVTLVCGHDESIVMSTANLLRARQQQQLAERWLGGERYVA